MVRDFCCTVIGETTYTREDTSRLKLEPGAADLITSNILMIWLEISAIQLRELICLMFARQRINDLIDIPGEDVVELV